MRWEHITHTRAHQKKIWHSAIVLINDFHCHDTFVSPRIHIIIIFFFFLIYHYYFIWKRSNNNAISPPPPLLPSPTHVDVDRHCRWFKQKKCVIANSLYAIKHLYITIIIIVYNLVLSIKTRHILQFISCPFKLTSV